MAAPLFAQDGVTVAEEGGGVLSLTLDRGECRISPMAVGLLEEALGAVERAPHPKALVIIGKGKFFCNGLDVEWMAGNPKESSGMIESFWRVLARVLVMDCHTVCAINGHGFGAGLFLALACDWRIMSSGKAWVNFPELNLGMRLSKGFAELTKAKLSPAAVRTGVLTARRFTSSEALSAGIVDAECSEGALLEEACRMAAGVLPTSLKLARFSPGNLVKMKIELYTDAYRALTVPGGHGAKPEARL